MSSADERLGSLMSAIRLIRWLVLIGAATLIALWLAGVL